MQQSSSLVFVAIIGVWAAYLLPQWVRRREALSQSRGRDRHSSGLRVLSRRHRPVTGPSTTPLLPDPRTASVPGVDPLGPPADRGPAPERAPVPEPAPAQRPVGRVPSAAARAARRRARVLSLLVVLTVTAWTVSTVVPVAVLAGQLFTALLALDLLALVVTGRRRAVRRAQANRDRRRRAEAARRAETRRPVRVPSATPTAPRREQVAAARPAPVAPPEAVLARPERASERVARELDQAATAAVWTPVPVPPPTYTLKAAVPRPEPAPLDLPVGPPPTPPTDPSAVERAGPVTEAPRTPRPWDADRTFADDLDLDAVLARRRAVNG